MLIADTILTRGARRHPREVKRGVKVLFARAVAERRDGVIDV